MRASEFVQLVLNRAEKRGDVEVRMLPLKYYNHGTYWFPHLASMGLESFRGLECNRVLLIRAGIHGEETAGPLTLLYHLDEIFDYAHKKNFKLIVYPLGNPSGFESGTRYSVEDSGKSGFAGNNDFLRYLLADGSLVDDLGSGNEFAYWLWSSDPSLGIKLPKETLLMHDCLKRDLVSANISGVLDLHQDFITKDVGPLAYHYAFGDLSVYKDIIDELRKFITVGQLITAAGFPNGIALPSDENGFIVRHDGTLTDIADRLGIKYNVTVETTGCTPLDVAIKVNLVWIKGIIDLISSNH